MNRCFFVCCALLALAFSAQAQNQLYAYEDFSATGPVAPAQDQYGNNTGSGWASGFDSHDGDPPVVESSPAMTYRNLTASGNRCYRDGGRLGRALDVSKFGSIGTAGTTLWMSILISVDVDASQSAFWVSTHQQVGNANGPLDNNDADANWALGIFAASYTTGVSSVNGKTYWTIGGGGHCGLAENGGIIQCTNYHVTSKEVVTGETEFFVIKFDYTSSGTNISLFVNPTTLGGAAPTPDAQVASSTSISYNAFAFNGDASGSIGEIRFGNSYAAVTPTTGGSAVRVSGNRPCGSSIIKGQDRIQLSRSVGTPVAYKVCGANGQVISQGILTGNQLSIASLKSGLYVLSVDKMNDLAFVKQ